MEEDFSNLYTKLPIPVEAYDFTQTKVDKRGESLIDGDEDGRYFINTLEGKHYVRPNDFIIIGVKKERYPIRRDIFLETYQKYEVNDVKFDDEYLDAYG